MDKTTIYLIPSPCRRYRWKRDSLVEAIPDKCLEVASSHQMLAFMEKYTRVEAFPHGPEGVVDWSAIRSQYNALSFRWYKPFWKCHRLLQEMIQSRHLWEWYANIQEPTLYIWD
jgi:hypothetical protein